MSGSAHILVVDDVQANRDLTRRFLEHAGYRVEDVPGGHEALAALEAGRFDLVLMDVQMPGLDGMATTRAFREREAGWRVPVIAMTANFSADQIEAYHESGMDAYLGKPFRRAQLLDLVAQWLRTPDTHARNGGAADTVRVDPFSEARDLMGECWVRHNLGAFEVRLEEVLGRNRPALEREQLAHAAHELVARAAMFGFSELADALAALEGRCKGGGDVAEALETARHRAREAMADLRRYLGNQAGTY